MNYKKATTRISTVLVSIFFSIAVLHANEKNITENGISPKVQNGIDFFQGSKRFENGGPACVSCHNVTNENIIAGGLFAKDLTDVYSRLGDGITGWLMAPPFPAMDVAYKSAPLTQEERESLTAFFKYANETKGEQIKKGGFSMFIIGGGILMLLIFFTIELIWGNRKKHMVKDAIFRRQSKSPDAKF